MKYEIGKIYSFPNKKGAYLYKGGEPSNQDSWEGNVLSGPVSATTSGASFAFQDEILGGLRGLVDPSVTMQQGIDLERKALDDYRKKNPLKSLSYEVGGAVVPTLLSGGASAPIAATKIGSSIAKASGAGALYGVGSGEGVSDRVVQGGIGGAIGAGAGLAGGVIQKPITNLSKMVKSSFQSPKKIGEKEAVKLVKDAIEYDKTDINSAIKYILDRSDKQYALADIGPNSRAYLDAVNVLPGRGKKTAMDFLTQRNSGTLKRIKSDLTDAFGEQGSYFQTYNAIESVRKASGEKMYKKAFETKVPATPELTSLLKTDVMQDALNTAYKIANAEKVKLPNLVIGKNGKLLTQKGAEVTDIDTKFLHYMKLGLDDAIYTSKSPISGVGKTLLRANTQIKHEFLDYLDGNNPAYKAARNQWAEKSAILDALDMGRNILKPSTSLDELTEEISKMSQSEKLAFRNGVINTIIDKMETSVFDEASGRGTNLAFNIIKTPKNKELLRLTFPKGPQGTRTYNKFMSKLNDEVEIKSTSNQVIGNSATMGRNEAVSAVKNALPREEINNLSPVGVVYGLFKSDFDYLSTEAQEAAANKLANMLTATDPKVLEQIRREVGEKGFVKGILTKYIPNLASIVGKSVIAPETVGTASGITSRPLVDMSSQAVNQNLIPVGLLNQ